MFSAPVTSCTRCPVGRAAEPARCPFTPTQRAAGALVCAQGEVPERAFFVRDGLVVLSDVRASGGEAGVALRGPGSFLGAESLVGKPAGRQVRTVTATRLCTLERHALEEWLGSSGSPARTVLSLVLEEGQASQSEARWRTGSSEARLARFALAHESAMGPLRKNAVAELLGMRPETYSRCLRQLVEKGLLARSPPHRIVDEAGLRGLAQED